MERFYQSSGKGQCFKVLNDFEVLIVCEYKFNPCIEKANIRKMFFEKLEVTEIDEKTFNDARERVSLLLNQL